VKLHRGTKTILATKWSVIARGPLHALLDSWKGRDDYQPDHLLPEEEKKLNNLTKVWKRSNLSDQQRAILGKALKETRRSFGMLAFVP